MPQATDSKASWRRWAKAVRATLDVPALSQQLVKHLLDWPDFAKAEHVLTYLAFNAEFDLSELISTDKQFYVTRTWPHDRGLTVHPLSEELEPHPLGYLQPRESAVLTQPKILDLVLTPGLCFDVAGTRLGYGKGYFDRLLPLMRPGIPLIGVTSDALIVPALPHEAFDIAMTELLSESGLRSCRS